MRRFDLESVIREGNLVTWLMDLGILKKDVFCDFCNEKMMFQRLESCADGAIFRCGKDKCKRARKSVRSGSILWGYKLTLEKMLRFIYEWSVNTKLKDICRELDVSKSTAVAFSDMLRHVVYRHVSRELSSKMIGGP